MIIITYGFYSTELTENRLNFFKKHPRLTVYELESGYVIAAKGWEIELEEPVDMLPELPVIINGIDALLDNARREVGLNSCVKSRFVIRKIEEEITDDDDDRTGEKGNEKRA